MQIYSILRKSNSFKHKISNEMVEAEIFSASRSKLKKHKYLVLTFHLDLFHRCIHFLLCQHTSMGIYILRFYRDCHWLLGKDLKWRISYRKVASSRLVYYSILELFGQRSQYIASNFPFIGLLKILGSATNRDSLLLATLRYSDL